MLIIPTLSKAQTSISLPDPGCARGDPHKSLPPPSSQVRPEKGPYGASGFGKGLVRSGRLAGCWEIKDNCIAVFSYCHQLYAAAVGLYDFSCLGKPQPPTEGLSGKVRFQ
jgi:hypothetical protein